MERPTLRLAPPPPPHGRLRERVMSTRTRAVALAPGLLLALVFCVGEAAAQNVCRGGSHTGSGIITCIEGAGSSAGILVNPGNLGITSSTVNAAAVEGNHSGSGGVELRMTAGSIVTTGTASHGLYARHVGATGGGAIVIGMSGGSIETRGSNAYAIRGRRASGTGNVRIDVTGGSLSRTGGTGGVVLGAHGGTGDVTVTMTAGATLEATGTGVRGLTGSHSGTGDLTVSLTGGSVATTSNGVSATRSNAATAGNVAVTVSRASSVVRTTGNNGHGLAASNSGSGDATVTMRDGLVETTGGGSRGISAYSSYRGTNPGTVSVVMEGGAVRTSGGTYANVLHAHGIYAESNNGHTAVSVRMTGGAVETAGASANGIVVFKAGPGGAGSIEMTGGSVTTAGDSAHGAYVYMYSTGASTEGLSIDAAGAVSAEGLNARGLLGVHTVLGSATVRTRAAAEIAAPFAVGMEGRLTNDASAAGRIVVTHGGAVEARDVGVLAWAARSSGHTMGAGATTADDAARTAPMIHVTSSGDVTVGASVSDAFIRARTAGADETLSTGEQAVLSAITSGDSDASDALTTALAALPDDDYDAAWKAEAQDLLRKRAASSAAPTGDGPAAHRAAEEILGLSRAGVRAAALSHTAIADHVRGSDALSAAERTALEAVLTKGAGSELETALTALTGATYTTAWKDTVRQHAATYNAGDIHVDVTGGAIAAEGNGVEALYAVPHDRNGAIAVTVAEGARVTGGANGLYVRGAGAGEGDLRAQSVTVDGRVTGGTGAGVRMIDGGRLTVGRTGRIGATSGVGVLSEGAGDLHATVAGTVEGDVQVQGGGALTLNVREGGAVTGTVRDPVGLPTVVGSIGRLLYTNGATVTVADTGALTGVEVEGKTEALRSETGDLDVTVAGMVAGDLRAPRGGTLTLNLREGGAVTGTVRDPVGLPTVVGSIGRLLYTNGATVTVADTGKLTGVEGEAEALRSEAGDLDVTVAGMVAGDLRAPRGGTLTLNLREGGAVTGTVRDPVGLPTVVGSIGRLLYTNGATVTVADTGKLTGVEGEAEALRSEAGDLDVTVAGMVAGDLRAPRGGTLTLNLREGGAVTGTVHDPVGLPTVVGSIGRLLYTNGATVTVADTGKLTGVEGEAEALHSEAGDLDLTVAGMVTGDVFGLGAGEHTVTVSNGGTVTGTVHLAASTVTVHGRAGRVRFDKGGMVTVGSTGWITGIEDDGRTEAIKNEAGDLMVSVAGRVGGDIDVAGAGSEVRVDGTVAGRIRFRRGGMVTVGPDGKVEGGVSRDEGVLMAVVERRPEETTRAAAVGRAFPNGPGGIDERTIQVKPEPEFGRGVYEALPSVLLGLNRLPDFRERMAAPRTANGGWARVETFRGKWKADESTTEGLEYDHRRHGLKAGVDAAVGEAGLLGVSFHHRQGSAEAPNGGEIDLSGNGVGVSGTWAGDMGVYVDVQAEVTWYGADLRSASRGVLKTDVSGLGHALGMEVGRRVEGGRVVLTPRARLAHSRVSVDDFTDAVGTRVSLEDGRSLKGRAGVVVETAPDGARGNRVFGSVDVEHEFSDERKVVVSGTELKSKAEAMWLRLGLNGSHTWDDGRYTVQGGMSYATSGGSRELGGGVSLNVRF